MGDILTRDNLIAALSGGQNFWVNKQSQTAEGAGAWHSLWKAVGQPPAGANPPLFSAGSGYVPTNATTGALPMVNASAGNTLRALFATLNSSTAGTLILADRVWACSGFGTVITTSQAVTTPGTVTRDGDGAALGVGCEVWGEVYTAPGATAATWTVGGIDSAGTTGRTWTYAHPANAESVGQMYPFFPGGATPGAMHVRQVNSFIASATSGTAGDVGITVIRRLAQIPLASANLATVLDAITLAMPRLYDASCPFLMVQCSSTNTGLVLGNLTLGQN